MPRLAQSVLLASALSTSWFGMQAVHELGHAAAAWATGGTVRQIVLHPLTISRTDVAPNPAPLVVAWAGPLVGAALPVLLAGAARLMTLRGRRYFAFFAGFCLIANGSYIAIGAVDGAGDAGDMLRHGSPLWLLVAFGIAAAIVGFWIWHRTSGEFGFGTHPRSISGREAWAATAVAAAVTTAAGMFGQL